MNRLNRHQEALQKFKWEIYRASDAKGSVFDRVLQSISSRDYDTAMQLLSQPPKGKEQIFRQIRSFAGEQGLTIEERNKRLRAVMSYVYGSPLVTDKTRVTPRDFLNTRTDKVRTAEANILGLSGLDITAESKFNSVAAHTPQELAQFVPLQGQHLSSMIVSTSLRAQHRVDVYPASVEVSGAHIENIDDKPAIKAKLLRHPTLQADIDERYHDTLAQLDMTPDQFSREQYVKYLETGNTQDLPSGVQPVDNKGVKWYEARAMISSSNCLNLTYALGYPVFVGTPDEQVAPQSEMVEIYGLTVTERRVNLGASARQQDKPRGTTTPGTEENPDPNAETTPGTIDNGPNDAPPPQTGDSGGTSEGHHEGGSFGDTPSPGAPSPETPSP